MRSSHRLLERATQIEASLVRTPICRLEHPRVNLFAKLEFCNPVGSVKDKPAFWALKSAITRGEIQEQTVVMESSSGNFANALSHFCRQLGLRFIPVIDPDIASANESRLSACCDRVIKVTERDDAQGYLKTRLEKIEHLQGSLPHTFWTNQYANPDVLEAHHRFAGGEICEAFQQLDYVFVGVSTAGTIGGISRRVKETFPRTQIVAVDAQGSVIFGGPPGRRYIPGIGATIVPPMLEQASIDHVISVPERDAVAGCRALLREHGIFAGGSTGSAYSAIGQMFSSCSASRRPNVLFLCCDRGDAYLDTVFDDRWVAAHLEAPAQIAVGT